MTPPKKPEWFELTESDGVKPRASVKRSARGVLLALPLLLIGVGVVVAQGTDESPAVAESITTVASAASSREYNRLSRTVVGDLNLKMKTLFI